MKRHLIAASALTLALAGCGRSTGDDTAGNTTINDTATVETTGSPGSVGANGPSMVSPENFVEQAAISDMYEIEASKIALEKAKSPAVKAFAQEMIDAHTATTAKLKQILPTTGLTITPPTALDNRRQAMIDLLQKQDAEKFDKDYVDQQTTAHRDALGLMDSFATHGENAALKGFAAETKPKIQMHLEKISDLDHAGADETKGAATGNTSG